jgi:thiol:disulfide interchange protein DsbD
MRWAELTLVGVFVLAGAAVHAQSGRPRATVTPLVEREGVRPGPARVALSVSLPEGYHVQSNKPRDPSFIPTELTVDPPTGVTVKEVVFPKSTDLKQATFDQPLAVFEREFAIGVELNVSDSAPVGQLTVPVHLRYQACDDKVCYAPITEHSQWTVAVLPAKARISARSRSVTARPLHPRL